jgi:hypothetical protein
LDQFGPIDELYRQLGSANRNHRFSENDPNELADFNTACLALIDRVVGTRSPYWLQANRAVEVVHSDVSSPYLTRPLYGIVCALKRDVGAGFTQSVAELAHADIFSDFFEMADHLLAEGYKDAAAVMVGGVLESHLRKLAVKHEIGVDEETTGEPRPRKAERLNHQLGKVAYSLLDQKSVTSWLDLRNKAAHGLYAEYDNKQVQLLSQAVKNFITRNPA